jgi:hypothetical protein
MRLIGNVGAVGLGTPRSGLVVWRSQWLYGERHVRHLLGSYATSTIRLGRTCRSTRMRRHHALFRPLAASCGRHSSSDFTPIPAPPLRLWSDRQGCRFDRVCNLAIALYPACYQGYRPGGDFCSSWLRRQPFPIVAHRGDSRTSRKLPSTSHFLAIAASSATRIYVPNHVQTLHQGCSGTGLRPN